MKYTNASNLPEAIVKAVTNDPYDKGACDYSVTGLLKPARMVALERIHADAIEEDVADRLWALIGQVGHTILERAGVGLVEKRLFAERNGVRISGQLDLLRMAGESYKSTDYKFTTVYATDDGPKDDWISQLNLGRWLAGENGIHVDSLEIVAIYRDWSKHKARREQDYPQQQAQVFPLPVWTAEKTLAFLDARIAAHESAKANLPYCSADERWQKADKWALMKKGNKRATKLHENEHDALAHQIEAGNGHFIEHRPGESVRCSAYCSVAQFCSQLKEGQR
jgi:hypothetical protein